MDFLARLVERQRSPHRGVRPELPLRYEPVADALSEVEDLTVAPRDPGEPASEAPSPALPLQRVVESRVRPAPESDPARPSRPSQEASQRRPLDPVPEHRVLVSTVREPAPEGAPPRAVEPHPAQVSSRRESPPPPLPPVELSTPRATAEGRPVVALPTPMLPAPAPADGAPVPMHDLSERPEPARSGPTTVSISIGRIEISPPDRAPSETRPRLEAPVTPARPAYRPRMSLEDYLDRPNRGRS